MSLEDKKLNGWTTISEIAFDYKNQKGEPGMASFFRYANLIIRGITYLNFRNPTNVDHVELIPNALNIVDLPSDYVDYTKVAVKIKGRLMKLTPNENIDLPLDVDCGEPDRDVEESDSNIPDYTISNYGIRGAASGTYFKIDKQRNQLIIEGSLPVGNNVIHLDYITSGVSLTTNTVIPLQCREALVTWLAWKDIEYDRTFSLPEKKEREHQFGVACEELDNFDLRFTAEELLDEFYASSMQTPKRS